MDDIFTAFRSAANPEKSVPMSAYMRNRFPFLGIPTPERKKLSRDFLNSVSKQAADWNFVFKCWEQPEREFQYLAKDYLAKLKDVLSVNDVPGLRDLATRKSWWDTVDGLDAIIGHIALRHAEVNDTLLQWSVGYNIWLRRIAIDHQLGRKEKTNIALLEQIIVNNFGQTEFFINKAIGWSLREYSKTDPGWARNFIESHRAELAPLSIREASKYI